MSYLGRKGAVAPLTSADIPVGIVEGTAIAFLENASGTQNLGGTYSTERMYLNDSYTLTGDVTITGHLALGTIADSDVVITQDSTERTITGSGTLDGGNVLQDTHRTSVTGMTGELGSAVTGSPNLNLGNATFPIGHCVQFVTYSYSSADSDTINSGEGERANISGNESMYQKQITITSGNKVFVSMMGQVSASNSADDEVSGWLGVYAKEGGSYRNVYGANFGTYLNFSHSSSDNWDYHNLFNISYLDTPTVTNPIYGAQLWRYKSTVRLRASNHPLVINLMEIQQ